MPETEYAALAAPRPFERKRVVHPADAHAASEERDEGRDATAEYEMQQFIFQGRHCEYLRAVDARYSANCIS